MIMSMWNKWNILKRETPKISRQQVRKLLKQGQRYKLLPKAPKKPNL